MRVQRQTQAIVNIPYIALYIDYFANTCTTHIYELSAFLLLKRKDCLKTVVVLRFTKFGCASLGNFYKCAQFAMCVAGIDKMCSYLSIYLLCCV